jgi:hypothetical protein
MGMAFSSFVVFFGSVFRILEPHLLDTVIDWHQNVAEKSWQILQL